MSSPVHLCHVFATFVAGGPQVRTCRLINALGGEFRHSIMAIDGRMSAQSLIDGSVDIEYLDAERGRYGPAYPLYLASKLKANKPQLLLTYNWGSMDAVMGSRVRYVAPHIHTEDGFGPDEANRQKRRRVILRKLLLRRSRAVIAPSQTLIRIMRGSWRIPESIVRYIPNGVDTDRFSPMSGVSSWRESLGIPSSAVVVGTVAHLRKEKNLVRLIRCVASTSIDTELHLIIVGDGPERSVLESCAAEHELTTRTHFVGSQQETPHLYHCFDIFALSSDTEQMPISLIEAMACGLPAVCTDVGDIKEMVAKENRGEVVTVGDDSNLTSALTRVGQDRQLRKELGRLNRQRALEEFDERDMIRAYRALYLDVAL